MFVINNQVCDRCLAILRGLADQNNRVYQADDQLDFRLHIDEGNWIAAQNILRNLHNRGQIKIESQAAPSDWTIRILDNKS